MKWLLSPLVFLLALLVWLVGKAVNAWPERWY